MSKFSYTYSAYILKYTLYNISSTPLNKMFCTNEYLLSIVTVFPKVTYFSIPVVVKLLRLATDFVTCVQVKVGALLPDEDTFASNLYPTTYRFSTIFAFQLFHSVINNKCTFIFIE